MPPGAPNWSTIQDAIYDWFQGKTGITVDWVTQKKPERVYPWGTLKRDVGLQRVSWDDETIFDQDLGKPQGEEIGITMAADREFFVSCQIATSDDSPGSNAHELMETAERALRLPSTREAFRVAGLAIVESEPIRDLDEVAGQQYISRAVMDVRFRLLAGVTERTGYIAKVGVHGTIKDVDGSTALDYSEDIQI